jgi:hypothetical protein
MLWKMYRWQTSNILLDPLSCYGRGIQRAKIKICLSGRLVKWKTVPDTQHSTMIAACEAAEGLCVSAAPCALAYRATLAAWLRRARWRVGDNKKKIIMWFPGQHEHDTWRYKI